MTAESGEAWFEADGLRRLVPIVALAVALVAAITQPSTPPDLLLACLPVVAFTIWAFVPSTPLLALSIAVIVPVVIAQHSGELEPLMFEASLLAFVVGRWALRRDEARRWVRRKRIFYTVVGIYLSLSLMWFAIDLLDDSSGYWFYWPMLGTGLGVLLTGIVLGGVGGLFGKDWERRQVEKYLGQQADRGSGPDERS